MTMTIGWLGMLFLFMYFRCWVLNHTRWYMVVPDTNHPKLSNQLVQSEMTCESVFVGQCFTSEDICYFILLLVRRRTFFFFFFRQPPNVVQPVILLTKVVSTMASECLAEWCLCSIVTLVGSVTGWTKETSTSNRLGSHSTSWRAEAPTSLAASWELRDWQRERPKSSSADCCFGRTRNNSKQEQRFLNPSGS